MKPTGNPAMAIYERGRPHNDGFLRKTFTLPVDDARAKAREIMREHPTGGYMTIFEDWSQMPDGKIQFTMRRLPTRISFIGTARVNRNRPWTAEDDGRLLELWATGRSSRSIGVALRRSATAVDARLRVLRQRDRKDVGNASDVAQ
jgi:hypothetical protein